jgi:DNA-binding winged helix-turn-helix (wHTH) protein/tetratricopeptide (TPR) repeat protein
MIYRFSDFTLDPGSRLLARRGVVLTLPARVFTCILSLLEHRKRAVSRDELIRMVWGRDNVSDNQLAQVVLLARRLLDDDGASQRLIRTVPGFGFHWIAPVDCVDDSRLTTPISKDEPVAPLAAPAELPDRDAPVTAAFAPTESEHTPAASEGSRRRPGPFLLLPALTLVLLLTGLAAWFWNMSSPSATRLNPDGMTGSATRSSVWVLPVTMPVADAASSWARLGLMDLVSERLRAQGLIVVPVENVLLMLSAREFDGDRLDPGWLQREFGATLVVQARVQREGMLWAMALTATKVQGEPLTARAADPDLVVAAQQASDALLELLGMPPVRGRRQSNPILASIRQAIRGAEFEAARASLVPLLAAQPVDPEAQLMEIELELAAGRLEVASRLIDQRMADAVFQADPRLQARLLLRRVTYRRRAGLENWSEDVDQAVALLQKVDAPQDLARVLLSRGAREIVAGRLDSAALDCERARRLYVDLGDDVGVADARYNLATIAIMRGRQAEALEQMAASARDYERFGAVTRFFTAVGLMVGMQIDLRRWDDALASSDRAAPYLAKITAAPTRQAYLYRRASLMLGLGRLVEARNLIDEARAVGDGPLELSVMITLDEAELQLLLGHPELAFPAVSTALDDIEKWIAAAKDAAPMRLELRDTALLLLVRTALQLPGSASELNDAVLTEEQLTLLQRASSADGLQARALWFSVRGRSEEAESLLRQALLLADSENQVSSLVSVTEAMVELLLRQNRVDEADQILGRLMARDPDVLARDFVTASLLLRVRHAAGDVDGWRRALAQLRQLAGERHIDTKLMQAPTAVD